MACQVGKLLWNVFKDDSRGFKSNSDHYRFKMIYDGTTIDGRHKVASTYLPKQLIWFVEAILDRPF
jgi:hypothetical protein